MGVREPLRIFEVKESRKRFILSGHHRVEAVKRLRKISNVAHDVPVIVEKGTEEELQSMSKATDAVVSNVLQSKLNLIERAAAYRRLLDSGMSIRDICGAVGDSDKTVRNVLDVWLLPDGVKVHIASTGIKDAAVYRATAKWKRDNTIDLVKELSPTKTSPKMSIECNVIKIDADRLRIALKTKAKLTDGQIDGLINSVIT